MPDDTLNSEIPRRLLSKRDLRSRGHGSDATIYRKVRRGDLPPPVVLSASRVAWWEHEIVEVEDRLPRRTYGPSEAA